MVFKKKYFIKVSSSYNTEYFYIAIYKYMEIIRRIKWLQKFKKLMKQKQRNDEKYIPNRRTKLLKIRREYTYMEMKAI